MRLPSFILVTVAFLAFGILLWKTIPSLLSGWVRVLAMVFSSVIYFPVLGLCLWGLRSLGEAFAPSSSLIEHFQSDQSLLTGGPFAYVRHSMYLAVVLIGWASLLIFRTWTMAVFTILMLALDFRARREEQALVAEFEQEWLGYAKIVPPWFPSLSNRRRP